MPLALNAVEQLHRHGIEHFIAHHHALQAVGPLVQPLNLMAPFGQFGLLPGLQGAGQVHDVVALQGAPQALEFTEQLVRQSTTACAKFPHFVGAGGTQSFCHLLGQGGAKQGRQLGGRHKIAARLGHAAKLGLLIGVIAQTGLIQGQRHELIKRQPAFGRQNGLVHPRQHGGR